MNESVPCLLRIGDNKKKYRHLPLIQDKVIIGRAPDTTHSILSTWISRYHATIEKKEDGSWSLTDNKSLNGVSLNGTQLEALRPYTVRDGDVIQFGIPRSPGLEPEFVYRFLSSGTVQNECKKRSPSADQGNEPKRLCVSASSNADSSEEKEDKDDNKRGEEKKEDSKSEEGKKLLEVYEMELRALADKLKEKEEEKMAVEQQLERERQQRVAIEQIQKEQEERVSELDARKRHLEEERAHVEEQMQKELQTRLEEQERLLQEQMQQQLLALATEKAEVEKCLQEEMEKAVQEKDRQLQERLKEEKERLEKVIESKELQQKALENQLMLSRKENENALEDKLKEKESILSEFASTMETELQCAICSELFVQATSLNCSHAFCAVCIQQWLALKKECPSCRTPVTSSVRSLVLDNYIDKMVEQLSIDLKERRQQLVAERNAMQAKMAANEMSGEPSGTRGRRRETTRGRGRGGRGRSSSSSTPRGAGRRIMVTAPRRAAALRRAAAQAVAIVTEPTVSGTAGPQAVPRAASTAVIVVSDESDESEDENSEPSSDEEYRTHRHRSWRDNDDGEEDGEESGNSDDDYNSLEVRAYHGLRHCFKCGDRGHQASRCPF